MAKRSMYLTQEKLLRMLQEGRGQGEKETYKPWLRVLDVSSIGFSTTVLGYTTGRIHHFLSNLELDYFYILDWSDQVIDIREQFPLINIDNGSIEEVQEIANELGIEYCKKHNTDEVYVMTTDFFITQRLKTGKIVHKARTIKYEKDLENTRTIEKFQIEKVYWERRGIDWKIVTRKSINQDYANNIRNFRPFNELQYYKIPQEVKVIEDELIRNYMRRKMDLEHICCEIDNKLSMDKGTTLTVLKFLIYNKYWIINMNKKIKSPNEYEVIKIMTMEEADDMYK